MLIITSDWLPAGMKFVVARAMLPPLSLAIRTPKTMQSRSAAEVSLIVVTSMSKTVVGSVSSTTGIGGVRSSRPMEVCS